MRARVNEREGGGARAWGVQREDSYLQARGTFIKVTYSTITVGRKLFIACATALASPLTNWLAELKRVGQRHLRLQVKKRVKRKHENLKTFHIVNR